MILIADVQRVVARHYGIRPSDITSEDRARLYAHPRQVAMYLSRELTHHSLLVIGRWFHRHHTTVIHGIRSVDRRSAKSRSFRRDLDQIREGLA